MITLRDYQNKLMNDIRRAFVSGSDYVLCVAPTGSGKGVLNAYIAENAVKKKTRVMTIVHRNELVEQLSSELKTFGIKHGVIKAGDATSFEPVIIASVQTLVRRLAKVPQPDLIVVDEAHHLTHGSTWGKVLDFWPNARVIGLTATPQRLDGKGLGVSAGGYFQAMVNGPEVSWLIDQGHLAKYKIFMPPTKIDMKGIKKLGGDFAKKELNERVNKPQITGDAVSHFLRLARNKRALVFCVSVSHSEDVAAQFQAAGINAVHLDGKTPKNIRAQAVQDFRDGKIQVLTNVDLFGEGFNVPGVEVVVLLRPTQSLSLWKQMIGRALRPAPGKSHAIILDHVNGCFTHGLPDDTYPWTLEGKQKKKKTEASELLEGVKSCTECFCTHRPSPICPNCGFEYPIKERKIEEVDGELRELTEADIKAMKLTRQEAEAKLIIVRKKARMEVGQAKSYEELKNIGIERGYAKGWAGRIWNIRKKRRA